MEATAFNRINNKWKKRSSLWSLAHRSQLFPISILLIFALFFYFSYNHFGSNPLLSVSRNAQFPQCAKVQARFPGEKFLWYAPHSGFSNQLSEFKNAFLMAAILNRTLIVPPVLDHHAVALGSCPKFRVMSPNELRFAVLNHSIDLIASHRYLSMADVSDFSSLVSESAVRVMDFRVFLAVWCGVDINFVCSAVTHMETYSLESIRQCALLLSGYGVNVNSCLYALEDDCRTTVWTYQSDGEDGGLDPFQPDDHLKKKKKILFVRRQRDVYKTVGPGSKADVATVLVFGSLFTAPYKGSQSHIDIRGAPKDQTIQSLIEKLEYVPFTPEILHAGKEFALETIQAPFLCTQLRLLDGQFKNHWNATFLGLKQKLESLRQSATLPIHVFVMTDLPLNNWTGSYLENLSRDSGFVKLYFLKEEDTLVKRTAKKLVASGHGFNYGYVNKGLLGTMKDCNPQLLPDILLYIEEAVCSCASLGFVGTAGSTIAENVELMRKHSTCLK